jgi:hypothetical protein
VEKRNGVVSGCELTPRRTAQSTGGLRHAARYHGHPDRRTPS